MAAVAKDEDDPTNADMLKLPPKFRFAFVMMKYFGFPIMVACAFGFWIYRQDTNSRADREADRKAFVGAIDRNTEKISALVEEIRSANRRNP